MATRVMRADEIGQEGMQRWHGIVSEAYLSTLQWPGAYAVYDEMRRRDPTLRSILNAVKLLGRQASWTVTPGGDTDEDQRAAAFLADCMEDMSHTVADFIDDALTMLPFGWASAEIVYKRREDGRIGWQKLAYRRQSSLERWEFDKTGGFQGWHQQAAPDYQTVFLPVEKLLHFVAERDGTNPEGLALFESAYEPWYFVKNLQIISGIGWQRAFVGLPVFEFEETPSDADKALVQSVAQGLQVGSTQFVSVPPTIKFRLETVPNTSAESLLNTIRMFRVMMTQMVLADFIWLGSAGSAGSWSLGSDKSTLFLMAANGFLDVVAKVWNRFGVSRLMALSEFAGAARPKIEHSNIRKYNLGQLGSFVAQIANYIPVYESDVTWLRDQVGMPEPAGEVVTAAGETAAQSGDEGPQDREDAAPGTWMYPEERDPVGAAASGGECDHGRAAYLREVDAEIALAEVDYQREEERRELEATIKERVQVFFEDQQDRVVALVRQGLAPLGEDAEMFWDDETTAMRRAVLQDLLRGILALAEMAIDDVEEDFAGGADWTEVNADAAAWARTYTGDLIRGITETTKKATRETVATWIETGEELDALIEALTPTFGERRAELIGVTEVTRAYDEANDLVRQRVGLPAAEAKAPAHPKCRCYTRPVFTKNTWLIVWNTVRDERVCTQPVSMPWGRVNGCRALHGVVVGGPAGTVGRPLSEVRAELDG